jgi:hypothetical protein
MNLSVGLKISSKIPCPLKFSTLFFGIHLEIGFKLGDFFFEIFFKRMNKEPHLCLC